MTSHRDDLLSMEHTVVVSVSVYVKLVLLLVISCSKYFGLSMALEDLDKMFRIFLGDYSVMVVSEGVQGLAPHFIGK